MTRPNGTLMARAAFTTSMNEGPGRENLPATWASSSERVTGIEPALSAWEADVLPLNYTRERASLYPIAEHHGGAAPWGRVGAGRP